MKIRKTYKEIKEAYDNAKTAEEQSDALCELTNEYLFGNIEKEDIDDYLIEQCPEIYFDDYLDEEYPWEWDGISKEEYLKKLDEETNHNIEVKKGDIVKFDVKAYYDNDAMRYLVITNHRFLVIDSSKDVVLVYAMTTKVDRKNKFPNEYTEVQSGDRKALVQLNAFGFPSKNKIEKVVAKLSKEDLIKVLDDLNRYHKKTTTCECFQNARIDKKVRFEDWND